MIVCSRKPSIDEATDAEVLDLLALVSALLSTLNNMENQMRKIQAPASLYRYQATAHGISTRLQGRLLDVQGRATLARLLTEETNR